MRKLGFDEEIFLLQNANIAKKIQSAHFFGKKVAYRHHFRCFSPLFVKLKAVAVACYYLAEVMKEMTDFVVMRARFAPKNLHELAKMSKKSRNFLLKIKKSGGKWRKVEEIV
ncbi:MAG: hypothetical protein IKX44_10545 [Prevotella sp.]|nr:hypothetical protein [Prevotella sp.]